MKKILFILFLLGSQIVYGQGKADNKAQETYKKSAVIKTVKAYMKAENYNGVLTEIENTFKKYETTKDDAEYYSYLVRANEQLALQENKKMYLETKPDTVKYFTYLYNMYRLALVCDSIEQITDLDGKQVFKYRYDNANILLRYRQNLRVATNFFYRKRDYAKAYQYVDMYCTTKKAPLFYNKKNEFVLPDENDNTAMSVLAVLSAFGSENNEGVVKYLDDALEDKSTHFKILELGCKSYFALNDTANAVERLKDGFNRNPGQEYFFMSLVKYYNDSNRHEDCLELSKKMVEKFPNDRNYWFIKAKEEEILGKEQDAIKSYETAISKKNDDAESFSSIGMIYSEMAHKLYKNNTLSVTNPGYKEFKTKLRGLYSKAKDAYESSKKYAPNVKTLWYDGLRNAYFRLNMGKELKELEKIK